MQASSAFARPEATCFSGRFHAQPVSLPVHQRSRTSTNLLRATPSSPLVHSQPARKVATVGASASGAIAAPAVHPITLTDNALAHLQKLQADSNADSLLLRIGVRSGGCSGMSYAMDFESEANVQSLDSVMEYADGFKLVCDQKSLLYLFGMQLDYSTALIGGGFQFHNPNAANSCGCGKSFGV